MGARPPQPGREQPCRLPAHDPQVCEVSRASPLARAALAQDPAAEMPSDSSVISVLLSSTWSHPESEQLVVMVYSLLTVLSSQGGSAWPS